MRTHRLSPLVAALAVAALAAPLAAGCGDRSPRAQTADGVRALGDDLTQLRDDVEFELLHARLRTRRQLEETFGELMVRADDQAEALAALDPPPSLVAAVDELHDAIVRERDGLWRVAVSASVAGPPVAAANAVRLRRASDDILDARRRLERALQSGGT
ncbi:hypothetical protein [Conexibacter woesei]|uniref:Uncharacterized protein n=1 Tax=Conexibacter woesei (strain DSM 14684 / CCUG 47730 / CIP 108061 / JCM 11494 / NBRC 100937 / ID131577) TaxID=469383 RepID=D3FCR9_CONWI|nr:hypothetical protein [Conexibacter woesei]ADB51431.1 hypothetical protein Cwoe_3012 [Conexibacter woesei DSM 14684]